MAWTVLPNDSQILAIHVALLSNGKILIFPGDQHRGDASDFQHARLFNPATDLIEPCSPPTTDVFCSGHAFLGDGRIERKNRVKSKYLDISGGLEDGDGWRDRFGLNLRTPSTISPRVEIAANGSSPATAIAHSF